MDVLSRGQCDFQISFSNRDTPRNAWNRHWGNFMVDIRGSYQTIWSFPLTNVTWHSVTCPYTMTTPADQTLYRTQPFTEFLEVSIEHLRRLWHADRGRLLLRTPGPVPLRTCICSTCWDQRRPVSIRHFPSLWHYHRTWHFNLIWHFTRYWFHTASAKGVACRQGTLTPPDT